MFSNVSSNHVGHGMQKNIGCIPLCVFKCFFKPLAVCSLDVFSKCLLRRMDYHTNWTFLNCVFECVFNLHVGEDAKSQRMHLFSPLWALNVPSPQIAFVTVNLSADIYYFCFFLEQIYNFSVFGVPTLGEGGTRSIFFLSLKIQFEGFLEAIL